MMAYGDRDLTRCPARDRRFSKSWLEGLCGHAKVRISGGRAREDIVVTLPGSIYSVTYYKPEGSAHLLARHIADTDDRAFPLLIEGLSWTATA